MAGMAMYDVVVSKAIVLEDGNIQEKYRRKPQLSQAPSIRSKCAWLSCGVLIISSLEISSEF